VLLHFKIIFITKAKVMSRKIILFILFVSTFNQIHAQQDPVYAQYLLNPLLLNPAYAGLNNNFNGMVGYRTQWTGLEGQPNSFNASAHTSLVNNKVGAGILFSNDQIGNISNTETNISLAYKLNFKERVFSFGMQAGFQNYTTDYADLNIFDPTDNAFVGGERGSRMNIGAGAILKSEKFFIGLSVPRLLPSTFKNGGQEFELYNQHYYLAAAYVIYLNERIRLKPSALLRGVKNAPASVDLAMNVNINAIHTAGMFTRNFNTYGFLVQTLVKEQIRFGYVFELPTNKSVGTNFTTHEVSVGILLSAFSFHERTLSNF
jgi:type IX secretion system PorP/SprF family membrane protein